MSEDGEGLSSVAIDMDDDVTECKSDKEGNNSRARKLIFKLKFKLCK